MASDDEGFALSVTSKLPGSLRRSDTPHTCLMGRSGARLLGQETSGSYEQEYVRTGDGQASQKRQKALI